MKTYIALLSLIAAVAVTGAVVYSSSSAEAQSDGLVAENSVRYNSTIISQKFINQINILNGVQLSSSLFESPSFTSLIDWSRPLADQPRGRANPFAPLQ